MLTFSDLKTDLYRMIGVTSTTSRSDMVSAVATAIRRAQETFVNHGNWGFLEQLTDVVYIPITAAYTTGTVTVTQDSKAVTGSGTTFTADMAGSFLVVNNAEAYEIQSFVSTTSLTLSIPFQGSTASAQTYSINKRFYPLPLNFVRPLARDAKLLTVGTDAESPIAYSQDASFTDRIRTEKPRWFGIAGNMRRSDYFNTGTVTVATSGTTSTWTTSSGTLPTDIVDREVRIVGESRPYRIATRGGATTFTTYQTYYNPSDATSAVSAASYAITPAYTKLIGFSGIPDQRYVFCLPYIKGIDDLIAANDISPIVMAGYEDAFLTMCRQKLAEDGRTAMRAELVTNLIRSGQEALANAWCAEQQAETMKMQDAVSKEDRIQVGPSWISR